MKDPKSYDGYIGETNEPDAPIVNDEALVDPSNGDEKSQESCPYGGSMYSHGTIICLNGRDHKCKHGKWVALGTSDSC